MLTNPVPISDPKIPMLYVEVDGTRVVISNCDKTLRFSMSAEEASELASELRATAREASRS